MYAEDQERERSSGVRARIWCEQKKKIELVPEPGPSERFVKVLDRHRRSQNTACDCWRCNRRKHALAVPIHHEFTSGSRG